MHNLINNNILIGLLNEINQTQNTDSNGNGGISMVPSDKPFGIDLNYTDNASLEATSRNNGSITWMEWRVAEEDAHSYGFTYDNLNRLKKAKYRGTSNSECKPIDEDAYTVDIDYDIYGRISTLNRNGLISLGETKEFDSIDELIYSYNQEGELASVSDGGHLNKGYKNGGAYDYTDGNLTTDDGQGSTIEYNYLDLPTLITTATEEIRIIYDASGTELKRMQKDIVKNETNVVEYLSNVQYINKTRKSIIHAHGRVIYNTFLEGVSSNNYLEYNIKDHLGNVRVNFVDKNGNGSLDYDSDNLSNHEIVSSFHYYPNGMKMDGTGITQGAVNPFQYNGMEKFGNGDLSYSFTPNRVHDPALGMWLQVDPMAEYGVNYSPYNAMWNNPIMFSDPSGAIPLDLAERVFIGAISVVAAYAGAGIYEAITGKTLIETDQGLLKFTIGAFSAGFLYDTGIGSGIDFGGGELNKTINSTTVNSNSNVGLKVSNFKTNILKESSTFISLNSNWSELSKNDLSQLTGVPLEDVGYIFEDVWAEWASTSPSFMVLNYKIGPTKQYYSPNWNRNVDFDGSANGYDLNNNTPESGYRRINIESGNSFFEVKAKSGSFMYKNYANTGPQLDAISHNFEDAVESKAAFYYLITTANITDVSSLRKYADDKNINFGHYVPYYRYNNGSIYITFKARTQYSWLLGDFKVFGGNQNGVSLSKGF